jgi:hypothetical protein
MFRPRTTVTGGASEPDLTQAVLRFLNPFSARPRSRWRILFLLVWLVAGVLPALRAEVSSADAHAFIMHSGVNLPWINYGWDLGVNPWGGAPGGFHVNRDLLEADFATMRTNGIKICRVFLFGDFRSGLDRSGDGQILGLDPFVVPDMETLLAVASTNGVRLIPVLMDYLLANGVAHENGIPVGEHPEYITNAAMRAQLLTHALQPFLEQFGAHEAVYAWDIMNEPSLATAVSQPDILAFVEDVTAVIRTSAPSAKIMIGHYDRYHLEEYGNAVAAVTQIHYYGHMRGYWNFDTPAAEISDKPTFFGEVEPVGIAGKLDTALTNGYAGVLFWSLNGNDGFDFRAVAEEYAVWVKALFAKVHADLRITDVDVSRDPAAVNIRVSPTYPNGRYRVGVCDDLSIGHWRTVTNFSADPDAPSTALAIPGGGEKRLFFRIWTEL